MGPSPMMDELWSFRVVIAKLRFRFQVPGALDSFIQIHGAMGKSLETAPDPVLPPRPPHPPNADRQMHQAAVLLCPVKTSRCTRFAHAAF